MKSVLLLLLAFMGCSLLASFLLFLGLQVLEMNQWQGAALGIAMWILNLASLALLVAAVWRGSKSSGTATAQSSAANAGMPHRLVGAGVV